MKKILLLTLVFTYNSLLAQTTFKVDNFSKNYYGKIIIQDTSEVFSPGSVMIYDAKTNKQLIKVESDELVLSLHNGKALANITELPYGEQSLIIYQDFNFDGVKDLAICDGQNSCYHGPSFKIYLAAKSKFIFNDEFTKLAQEYCGMFENDYKKKKIYTMTKSGCCWHQFSEYIVKDNKPLAVKIVEKDMTRYPFSNTIEKTWNGNKMIEKSIKNLDTTQEGIKVVLSFVVKENDKQVVLFNTNDKILTYALLKKDKTVEYSYPSEFENEKFDFRFNSNYENSDINFSINEATYKIYEYKNENTNKEEIGIKVTVGGKTYDLKGKLDSKKGSLINLIQLRLDNVYMK